jgi:hypothetical protein
MALGGGFQDHYVRMFRDGLEHELQQKGSKLRALVTVEAGMGERTYFDKIGVATSYTRTTRYEDKQIGNNTFERRLVTPTLLESNYIIDELDLVRYANSPENDVVRAMTMELGRQIDDVIINALGGTAGRELNGASSNVAFDTSNNQIAVNTNTYTSLTGDTALHEGKLLLAKRILQTNHIDLDMEDIFVVASAKQMANLMARMKDTGIGRQDFLNMMPLTVPGLDRGLDGLFGMRFIASERLGVDGSSDQYAYVFPKSALKLAIYKDLGVDIHKRYDKASNPTEITANLALGAVRMFEEKVVRILCDPA